jgi:hypothetical protein
MLSTSIHCRFRFLSLVLHNSVLGRIVKYGHLLTEIPHFIEITSTLELKQGWLKTIRQMRRLLPLFWLHKGKIVD